MELFENKVGRPSNEILKKRRMFIAGISIAIIAVIIVGVYSLSNLSLENLKGIVYTKGQQISLSKAPIYVSEKIKVKYTTKTGIYYIYNSTPKNGRIRISKNKNGTSIGWVNISSIKIVNIPNSQTTTKNTTRITTRITTKSSTKISNDLTINVKSSGKLNQSGVYMFDSEGKKDMELTLKNQTNETRYYRWFTYSSLKLESDSMYYVSDCISYNKTITKTLATELSNTASRKAVVVRTYLNKSQCDADSKSTQKTFVTEKKIYYGLSNVYINKDGFKMILYDHSALSKRVGTQRRGECAKASYAHAAFILSRGKIVASKTNYVASKYGMVEKDLATAREVNSMIITKINNGLPVSLHVTNSSGEHWVTVVGYRNGKNNANLALSDIYIIDPFYSKFRYNSKSVTLWRGTASQRPKSVKSFHKDYKVKVWNKASDLKQP